jgi:hypothetical protein
MIGAFGVSPCDARHVMPVPNIDRCVLATDVIRFGSVPMIMDQRLTISLANLQINEDLNPLTLMEVVDVESSLDDLVNGRFSVIPSELDDDKFLDFLKNG